MALEFSTTPFVSAVQQIADSAGASGDNEMTTRAWRSLNAGIQHFNNRYKWNWLDTEPAVQLVVAPFQVTGVTASGGQASAAAPAGHGIQTDDWLLGSGFADGVRVSATAASGFGFTLASTGMVGTAAITVTANRDCYALPFNWKSMYSVRLLNSPGPLYPINRRSYDRSSYDQYTASTPQWYDTFQAQQRSKVRLIPSPNASEVLEIRCHRAMATASASAVTTTLDIPSDYEGYLISWAKWHFLTDKGPERRAQAETWHALGVEGLAVMLRDQQNQPDEAPGFTPGSLVDGMWPNDRSTRNLAWQYEGG